MFSIQVAAEPVADPLGILAAYCDTSAGTVRAYDLLPAPRATLTPTVIKVTRSPWMGSRISHEEAHHLLSLSNTAPWAAVPATAHLRDADPQVENDLYDEALRLHRHFIHNRRPGLGLGKISKCLHLTRPGLFPILDSAVRKRYRRAAKEAAQTLTAAGCLDRPRRRAYWAAIRQDLLRSQDGLAQLRSAASEHDNALVREAAQKLSDVRLLDILTWAPNPA
ncbi:hypothetical protein GA0070611_5667 [Micromonospora auratinigra]|uniref:Uncharacterized protein n=1 Tax=Micromonospora auratinigra TaxID=261654 RepID=A0A1A9A8S4_9ACTN|nr:hypothetical protein GA0070611_5667 [Micromonospora auratinigra]